MGARVPRIWYDLAPFDRERIARVGSFQQRKRIGQRHVLDWRRLDGLGARGVQGMARVLVDEVGALHGAAADAARIAVGGKALGDPAHGVGRPACPGARAPAPPDSSATLSLPARPEPGAFMM